MAMSLNKVTLIGNLGRDPEIRTTQDGREVASFSIATTDTWRDKNSGERKEKTEWHRVAVFAPPLVAIVKNYLHKGSKLYIEGSLQTRKWTDPSGVEKTATEVVLQSYNSTLMLLDARGGQVHDDNQHGDIKSAQASAVNYAVEDIDDEIPF
jgi:single-strand DNA-binding protein